MTFGSTLALKGAIEEQREMRPPHCESGCYCCALEAFYIFERYLLQQPKPHFVLIRKERHT